MEIAEKKMRAHIVEADGVQGTMEGWVSAKLLQCLSAECGHCFQCSDGLVPTDAAIKQENTQVSTQGVTHETAPGAIAGGVALCG